MYPQGWYNVLTDSLLQGKVSLPIKPSPELLALPDPYDPIQNAPYRVHDISLYKGNHYLYFGVVPAVTLFLPYRLIAGNVLPERAGIVLFSFGGLVFLILLLRLIKEQYFTKLPNWIMIISIALLGFANFIPSILRRPMMYEVAITGGFFFLSGAMYFLCRAFIKVKPKTFMLLLGSLFIGLASGCRHQIVLSGWLLMILALKIFFENYKTKSQIKYLSNLVLPYIICMLCLFVYNYVRFDNPFETGLSWQLIGSHPHKIEAFSFKYLLPGIYLNLFEPPKFDFYLPFIHLQNAVPLFLLPQKMYVVEKISGLVTTIPFVGLMIFFLLIYLLVQFCLRKGKRKELSDFPILESLIILIPALINLSVLFFHVMVTVRYVIDYVPYIVLFSCVLWFYFYTRLKGKVRLVFNLMSVGLALISIIFGIALGTENYFYKLSNSNPLLYEKIESFFMPLINLYLGI